MMVVVLAALAMGPPVRADSPRANPATHPATTRAADVVVQTFTLDPAPTKITAHLKNQSASELFAQLSSLSGVSILPEGNALEDPSLQDAEFSVDWDKTPFWSAMHEACEAAGVRVVDGYSMGRSTRLRVIRAPLSRFTCVDGPVRIRARRVMRSAVLSYEPGGAREDVIELSLQVSLEPRLSRWTWLDNPVIDKASDDAGHALQEAPRPDAPHRPGYGFPITALLRYPAHAGKRIALVRGSVPIRLAGSWTSVTFDHPLERPGRSVTVEGNQLILTDARVDPRDGYHVTVTLKRGKNESDEQWEMIAEAFNPSRQGTALIDARGEQKTRGWQARRSREEAQAQLYFSRLNGGGDPTALRVELPTRLSTFNAKFEFKDLPMP